MVEAIEIKEAVEPSLLRQIVDAADVLDDEGKIEILRQIKMQKALKLAKKVDAMLEGNTVEMTDEEVADIISEDRKKMYQSL